MSVFGERLRQLRELRGLGQKEVGAWIGVSDSSIGKYESSARTPNPDAIMTLAEKFGVTSDYLMGISNSPNPPAQSYYHDPEVAQLAQEMHDRPGMRVMFDASRKLSKQSMDEVQKFIEFQLMKEGKL